MLTILVSETTFIICLSSSAFFAISYTKVNKLITNVVKISISKITSEIIEWKLIKFFSVKILINLSSELRLILTKISTEIFEVTNVTWIIVLCFY